MSNINKESVKGVIFDYGGTIDTNSVHWSEVLWSAYEQQKVPVEKSDFRAAYVYGERSMAQYPLVKPSDNFHQVLRIKTHLQINRLCEEGKLQASSVQQVIWSEAIADACYEHVLGILEMSREVVRRLAGQYKLVLVSNFYGDIEAILKEFGLSSYFSGIVESSVVGVRKPDPAIYRLGVETMGFRPEEIVVIGDSFSKDIVPAKTVGCKAIWLSGPSWGNEEVDESLPDLIIHSLDEVMKALAD